MPDVVPGVAALLTCKYLGRDLATLGWRWGQTRYQVICYFIPLAYSTVIYAFVWSTGLGGFYNSEFETSFAKDFGLGPIPALGEHSSLLPLYRANNRHQRLRHCSRRRDWLARVSRA
jgi:hypothetical protein